jgi:hypothetical protein
MKNVMGSLLALVAVVSMALSVTVSANTPDQAKAGKVEKAADNKKGKEPPKPKTEGGEAPKPSGAPQG